MQPRFIKGAGLGAVAMAGVALAGMAQAAPTPAPYGHFSVEVIAGPGSISGFNGDTVQFLDPGNQMSWPATHTQNGPMTMLRDYRVRLTAKPGWLFDSISMFAHGGAEAGQGTWRGGTVGYAIGDASSAPISSGLLKSQLPSSYSDYYAQNSVGYQFSNLVFYAEHPVPTPGPGFTLDFTTNAYLDVAPGSFGWINFLGSNAGTGRTWEIDALMRAVPEPQSCALMLLGLLGLALVARHRPG